MGSSRFGGGVVNAGTGGARLGTNPSRAENTLSATPNEGPNARSSTPSHQRQLWPLFFRLQIGRFVSISFLKKVAKTSYIALWQSDFSSQSRRQRHVEKRRPLKRNPL